MNAATKPEALQGLLDRIDGQTARVGIIGLGYVGLPLAVVFAEAGLQVVGIDVNQPVADGINAGALARRGHPGQPPRAARRAGLITATTDFGVLAGCDGVSICVPTPLRKTGDPDISYILAATDADQGARPPRDGRRPGEHDVPRHDARDDPPRARGGRADRRRGLLPLLLARARRPRPRGLDDGQHAEGHGRRHARRASQAGARRSTGRPSRRSCPCPRRRRPRWSSCWRTRSARSTSASPTSSCSCATGSDLDAWEIIDAAATKPFGFMKFTPGPGLGGHCIPIDPLYLSWKLRTLNYTARFIELASEVNTSMPAYWVQKVQDALNEPARPSRAAACSSSAWPTRRTSRTCARARPSTSSSSCRRRAPTCVYHDPHVPSLAHDGHRDDLGGRTSTAALASADCTVIVTDHSTYDWDTIAEKARLVVDTRRALKAKPVTA